MNNSCVASYFSILCAIYYTHQPAYVETTVKEKGVIFIRL